MPIDNYTLIKNYFPINTDWEQAVNLLYKNAEGSQRPDTLWFKIKNRRLFDDIPDLKPFFEKINKESGSEYYDECPYYDNWQGGICNCEGIWHVDGPVISLDSGTVSMHRDAHDAAYLQMLGQSFWKLDGRETVVLNPGDILFISKKVRHEVWGEGPRMGILVMALKPTA
jgi:hypothetical protein